MHRNDRQALERLTRREDGSYEYRTKKGLGLSAKQLVKRLWAPVPPRGVHLTRFGPENATAAACGAEGSARSLEDDRAAGVEPLEGSPGWR